MADLDQIERALRAADAAGNTEDARVLAKAYADAKRAQTPVKTAAGINPAVDAIRSVPGGVAKGFAGLAGLPGDLNELVGRGTNAVLNFVTGQNKKYEDVAARMQKMPGLQAPTSASINKAISDPFGGYYQPQTTAGKYAETMASFTPATLSPGSALARTARVVVPGAASETAGQMAEGTAFEPYARALGSLAGGITVGGVEAAFARKNAPVPTLEQLGKLKDAAYKAADDAGVVIDPRSFQSFTNKLGSDVTKNNVVQTDLHKNTLAALNIIQDEAASGVPLTLARADKIRRAISGAIGAAAKNNDDDLRLAMQVKRGLDEYLDALGASDILAGNPSVAVPILKDARTIAQREFKAEEIQKMIDVATNRASSNYSASGVGQAIKAQFMQLEEKLIKNPNLAKSFTKAERDAIRNVVRGGTGANALRLLGKLAPTNAISMGVGPSVGAAAGAMIGGPVGAGVGAVAVPAAATAARLGYSAMQRNAANTAADIMRNGAPLPIGYTQDPRQLLINALSSQAAK